MEESSTFSGSGQSFTQLDQLPSGMGDHARPAVYSISGSGKDFYSTVDETAGGSASQLGPPPSVPEFRSRSNTPSTINVPQIPKKSSFGSLIPSYAEVEASLKELVSENDSNVPASVRYAWIPSERTSGALHAIASQVPAGDFLGADQITKPGIFSDKLFFNSAFDFAMRFVGTIPPSMLKNTPEEMIKKNDFFGLFRNGFFSSTANVSKKLLFNFEKGKISKHNLESMTVWMFRLAALTMLDQVELAAKELEAFGDLDNPDLYLEYYNQNSEEKNFGSMVPFPLRLLHARLPQRLGSPKITLERLFSIKDKIEEMLKNAAEKNFPPGISKNLEEIFIKVWKNRRIKIFYEIISAATKNEDFETAVNFLRLLLKLRPHRRAELWHDLGILYCHIGTPRTAKICFDESEKAMIENEKKTETEKNNFDEKERKFDAEKNNFSEEKNYFEEEKNHFGEEKNSFGEEKSNSGKEKNSFGEEKNNDFSEEKNHFGDKNYFRLLHQAILTVCEASPVQALDVYASILRAFPHDVSAANGVAIGHFYAGRMPEAMSFLENLLFEQPKIFLTEQTLRNLVAMYELQNIQVRERKLRLLSLICQFIPDGKGVEVLKLNDV